MTAPFGIGAEVYPGLAKVAEEAGELLQVIGKLVATSGAATHYDGSDLRMRLIEECGDLLAAVGYLTAANGITDAVAERAARKRELLQTWHDTERQAGHQVIAKPPGPHDHPAAGPSAQTSTVSP